MKRYANAALVYAIGAMVGGVFYREFTKLNGFVGNTTLSVVHTHYFLLGMVLFLLLMLLEKSFGFSNKKTDRIVAAYHVGLNLTVMMLIIRGLTQVMGMELSKAVTASISGMAGIGHGVLGVSLILLLLQIRKTAE